MTAKLVDLALQRESLLLLGAGPHSIRLRPSLSVTETEIDLLLRKLDRCLSQIQNDLDHQTSPTTRVSA
jgi:L-lysine 6-transaminase